LPKVKKLIAVICALGAVAIAATAESTPQVGGTPSAKSVTKALEQQIEGAVTLEISLEGQTTTYSRDEFGAYSVLLRTPNPEAPHPIIEFRVLNGEMYARGISGKLKQTEWLEMTELLRAWPALPDVVPPSSGEYNYMAWMSDDVVGHFYDLSNVVRGFTGVTALECFRTGGVTLGSSNRVWKVDCKTGSPAFEVTVDENSRVIAAANDAIEVGVSYTSATVVVPAKSSVLSVSAAQERLA
jgi:hypothetical protein